MKIHPSITLDRLVEAVESDENTGFCIHCGEQTDGVEPDARKYECEHCGTLSVYGAEELLLYMAV